MEKILLIVLSLTVSTKYSKYITVLALEDTRCSDGWTAYKDEKCVRIANASGLQTHEEAEALCREYANETSNIPKLLTIKRYEEQEFLHNFLFDQNKVIDHVWLGMKEGWKEGTFEWNDGSDVYFANWAEQNVSDDHHQCVQMESGEANDPPGIWVKVNCQKKNAVVCETLQNWTTGKFQTTLLDLKLQLLDTINEHTKTKQEFREYQDAAEAEIESLKNKLAGPPTGYIYMQLGGQAAPDELWPNTTWEDISSSYAGLFFRVVGGSADQFGVTQNGSSPRLKNVEWKQNGATYTSTRSTSEIPSDGNWSNYIFTGSNYNNPYMGARFQLSTDEVRPPNQAIKIWLRI